MNSPTPAGDDPESAPASSREETGPALPALLSAMSHEFRTPLNAILGFAQLLIEDKSLSEDSLRRAEGIEKAGEHLLRLVNEFLEVSMLESGSTRFHSSAFELPALLHEVLAIFEPDAEIKGIKLSYRVAQDTPTRVISDPLKLRQVLINLIGNAVKFTSQGGVLVLVSADDPVSDRCFLDVQVMDTGPGIDPLEAKNIFRKYTRGRVGSRKEGSGLGLAISKQHARLLGGDLTLESTVGRGSVFRLRVPVTWVRYVAPVADADFDDEVSSERPITLRPPAPESSTQLSAEGLALPEALAARLVSSAQAGDRDVVLEAAKELTDERLKHRVTELAQAYQYRAIVQLLEEILQAGCKP